MHMVSVSTVCYMICCKSKPYAISVRYIYTFEYVYLHMQEADHIQFRNYYFLVFDALCETLTRYGFRNADRNQQIDSSGTTLVGKRSYMLWT